MSKSRVAPYCILNYRRDLTRESNLNLFYSGACEGGGGDCIQTAEPDPRPRELYMAGGGTPPERLSGPDSQADTNQGHRSLEVRRRPRARVMSSSFRSLIARRQNQTFMSELRLKDHSYLKRSEKNSLILCSNT